MPLFFNFFFRFFFFFFLFFSLCFARFFRPSLEDEDEAELEELEEEEVELDRDVLWALCLLLSSTPEALPALWPWDLEAEQFLEASLLLLLLRFSDPRRPLRDRLRLLERFREPT